MFAAAAPLSRCHAVTPRRVTLRHRANQLSQAAAGETRAKLGLEMDMTKIHSNLITFVFVSCF